MNGHLGVCAPKHADKGSKTGQGTALAQKLKMAGRSVLAVMLS